MPTEPPAYIIASLSIPDREAFLSRYGGPVLSTLSAVGAEVLAAGPDATVLEGVYANNWTVIIRFPSRAVLDAWFASDVYAPLIEVRRSLTDVGVSFLLALNAFAPAS